MRIRTKIILSMLMVAILFLPMNFFLLRQYLQVRNNFLLMIDKTVPRTEALLKMQYLTAQINLFAKSFNQQFQEISGNENTPNRVGAAKDKFISLLEELGEQQKIYEQYAPHGKGMQLNKLRDEVIIIALEVFTQKEQGVSDNIFYEKVRQLEQKEYQLNEIIKALLLHESALLVEEREKTTQGAKALLNSLLLLNAIIIVIALLISLFLMRVISKPIMKLSRFANNIDYENLQPFLPILSGDEIGQLQAHLNEMLAKLNKARTRLIETSRFAGMAEITTGILHNVGNILNSMNTSIALLQEDNNHFPVEKLKKIFHIIEENKGHLDNYLEKDEKGTLFLSYCNLLVEEIEQDAVKFQGELHRLHKDLILVNQIISLQQQSGNLSISIEEKIELEEMVEDILVLYANRLRCFEINIERRFNSVPAFSAVKNKVQQILINLIKNAIESLGESDREKRMIISFGIEKTQHQKNVFFEVIDNGIGIGRSDLKKIFSFGFSTKEGGHGYGLHNCALLAKELGGQLQVNSKGPNQGACFTLKIPFK